MLGWEEADVFVMLLSLWHRKNMFEAISMEFLIASFTPALLVGQIVQAQELPGPS